MNPPPAPDLLFVIQFQQANCTYRTVKFDSEMQAHNTKRGTRHYSLINIKINVYFVAIRFGRRRFRYQIDHMDPLVLLLKQTSTTPPPPPRSSVCDIISGTKLKYRTIKFDSEMAVARLVVY